MANLQTHARKDTKMLLNHSEREHQEYGNPSIDSSRTKLNYNLHELSPQYDTPYDALNDLLTKFKANKRKDLKVMASWLITLPEELKEASEEKQLTFFRDAYSFLINRYGEEGALTADVHLDETTPHLHYNFCPLFKKDDGTYKVSARDVLDRIELKQFHKDLQEYFNDKGYSVTLYKGTADKVPNKSIRELKLENNKLDEQNKGLKTTNRVLQEENQRLEIQKDKLEEVIQVYEVISIDQRTRFEALVQTLKANEKVLDEKEEKIRSLEVKLKSKQTQLDILDRDIRELDSDKKDEQSKIQKAKDDYEKLTALLRSAEKSLSETDEDILKGIKLTSGRTFYDVLVQERDKSREKAIERITEEYKALDFDLSDVDLKSSRRDKDRGDIGFNL